MSDLIMFMVLGVPLLMALVSLVKFQLDMKKIDKKYKERLDKITARD